MFSKTTCFVPARRGLVRNRWTASSTPYNRVLVPFRVDATVEFGVWVAHAACVAFLPASGQRPTAGDLDQLPALPHVL